jgi:hypothetical protein
MLVGAEASKRKAGPTRRSPKDAGRWPRKVSDLVKEAGQADDWGKTMPFWCVKCGRGYVSVKRVLKHYAETGHGDENTKAAARGLTEKQYMQAFRERYK